MSISNKKTAVDAIEQIARRNIILQIYQISKEPFAFPCQFPFTFVYLRPTFGWEQKLFHGQIERVSL